MQISFEFKINEKVRCYSVPTIYSELNVPDDVTAISCSNVTYGVI